MTKEREIIKSLNNSTACDTELHEKETRKCDLTKLEKARLLIGQKFGHLTVLDIVRRTNRSREFYCKCQCDCGNVVVVPKHSLTKRKGCGNNCIYMPRPQKGTNSFGEEEFFKRAHQAHGDTYDYSRTKYINRYTPVEIVCRKHGVFKTTPQAHWSGAGCPECLCENTRICGVGISDYPEDDPAHKYNKVWGIWSHMIQRCYADYIQFKKPTYQKVSVCEEWHRYSNFRKWYLANARDGCDIDKDLTQHGQEYKVYSPETVVFLPPQINGLLITNSRRRGIYPIGVRHYNGRYYAYMSRGNRVNKCLGGAATAHEAFLIYKREKEKYIKELADKYFSEGAIDERTKDLLYNYKVMEDE